jgi:outer membrane protein assembly factor BamB
MSKNIGTIVLAGLLAVSINLCAAEKPKGADWPSWRGPNDSGSVESGYEMVDSLDKAKLAWKSDPVGYSGCMHPGKTAGTGFCDPVIVDGRVYLYWFDRSGKQRVEWEMHYTSSARGLFPLLNPEKAYGTSCGFPKNPKDMAELQSHINADDVFVCFDDRTGKTLWKRAFHERGFNHRKVYGPLGIPCVSGGRLYGLGSAGNVYALDAATGKTLWQNDVGPMHEVFEQWRETCVRTKVRSVDSACEFDTALALADGVVAMGILSKYAHAPDADVVAFDGATGHRLWTVPDSVYKFGTPNVWRHQGKEYFLCAANTMSLIEPRTGRVLWRVGGKKAGIAADGAAAGIVGDITDGVMAAISGDYVVVNKNADKVVGAAPAGSRGPSCYKIGLTGAKLIWSLPIDDCPGINCIAPLIYRGHAYVPMRGGLACVELETGKIVDKMLAGLNHAFAGNVAMDGLVFSCSGGRPLAVGRLFPDMAKLEGVFAGGADNGEIHTPAVANGRVYWRGRQSVWCYDFRKNPPPASTATLPSARDLGAMKDNPAQLADVIEKEGWPTRAAAADLLRAMGEKGKPASAILQKLLLTAIAAKDWGDTDLLLDTLLAIDPPATKSAAPELAKLLESPDELTLRLGFHALGLMGAEAAQATAALARHLDPAKPETAALAARTLGSIGAGASAAIPALLKCLEAKDQNLTCQAAKALCHLAPANVADRGATIDAVLALKHLLFVDAAGSSKGRSPVPLRLSHYQAIALSLLGKEAVPQFLERAKAVLAAGEKEKSKVRTKGMAPAPPVDYQAVLILASAAFTIDPKSAADFLPLVAKVPNGTLTERDLKGTIDLSNFSSGTKKEEDGKKAVPDPDAP